METLFVETTRKPDNKPQSRAIAEQIYVAVNRGGLPTEMDNAAADSASELRPMTKFGGDTSQRATMTGQVEMNRSLNGDTVGAEKLYLRDRQRESALFTYEQAKMWADAIRGTKENGVLGNGHRWHCLRPEVCLGETSRTGTCLHVRERGV
jgi:hypothetical protein